MAVTLTPQEARVLGVLIEKSLALPEYYPMTINAITAACNQKNNRDPITHYTEADVSTALHGLTRWQLVSQAPPDRNSRVNRFIHEVEKRFGWSTPQRAIMAELFLRGPQTAGELRANASRMFRLEALDYVNELLTELQTSDPPFVAVLPRQPGQSAIRHGHLLCGEDSIAVSAVVEEAVDSAPMARTTSSHASPLSEIESLRSGLQQIKAEVQALRDEIEALKARRIE
ncbi:MAG: UPF0502 protein [Phycisphaerae bacterium]|nr:MAG: YceH family protein [Planctomycetia bacterium]RIK71093.1 MAG: DUF480 domain-containing protein [Planctomycetota bacterium]GJQ27461.1 MAG: UPF0502 protein [Phycisphaerae bacterium]